LGRFALLGSILLIGDARADAVRDERLELGEAAAERTTRLGRCWRERKDQDEDQPRATEGPRRNWDETSSRTHALKDAP
jgi:hypothetical protein